MGKNNSYKIVISNQAKKMLASHIRFMAQVNKDAAKTKKNEIMDNIKSLSQMPQRFPFFNEMYIVPNKYRKMFVQKWYIILYQIKEDTVYVDYIIDCRKDYTWLINWVSKSYKKLHIANGKKILTQLIFIALKNH